jgi:regulator of cell morphogenesis and NO signaling
MFLSNFEIEPATTVSDIVSRDYRTAEVFRKYDIEYCCGGKWPLETVCMMKGLKFEDLKKELKLVSRNTDISTSLPYETWDVDFITSYIINVHHQYLRTTLPVTEEILTEFLADHEKKFPYMVKVKNSFDRMKKDIMPHIKHEEETIFPYICQVSHAYENSDSYARLLVKTLRKPLDSMMRHEHDMLSAPILNIRNLTNNYSIPEKACVSHKVVLSRLKELDNDLMQHIYLENEVLFPRTLKIEQELLK